MRFFKKPPSKLPALVIVAGSIIGLVAAFIQSVELLEWTAQPNAPLVCDISNSLSCSNVFGAWQSSVFGVSNALLCLTFFALMLGFAYAYLKSDKLAVSARLLAHFLSVFFLLFGAWYITQLLYSVGALCVYCIFCYGGVIMLNWGWLRANADDLPLNKSRKKWLKNAIKKQYDTVFWISYALIFVALSILRFGV
jgi:uncharacterized membrane protein